MCSNPCESEVMCFRPESNRGPYGVLTFLSAALSTTELWWQMDHRKSNRQKAVSQDLIPSSSIYIHMCTLYTHTNTYIPRVNPTGFLRPFRCFVTGPTPGLTSSTQCAVRMWVCVYTHIHNTLPPSIKNRENTRQNFYLSVCPKNSPR